MQQQEGALLGIERKNDKRTQEACAFICVKEEKGWADRERLPRVIIARSLSTPTSA
jgi:hypothetical protein